jgi:hypothetical protein
MNLGEDVLLVPRTSNTIHVKGKLTCRLLSAAACALDSMWECALAVCLLAQTPRALLSLQTDLQVLNVYLPLRARNKCAVALIYPWVVSSIQAAIAAKV